MSNGNENTNLVQPDGNQPWDPNRFNYYFGDDQKSTDDMFDAFTQSNQELENRGETNLPDFKTFIDNLVTTGDLSATLKSDWYWLSKRLSMRHKTQKKKFYEATVAYTGDGSGDTPTVTVYYDYATGA